ncbi:MULTISPECIES: flagellar biosynthesis anti-sigma factor FlgM [Sphingomonas]|uniref:Negative regulator of flagellin synthesis n=1 Tax=Sphingomonas kyungheensis TaxID=1069987 RepID=A0ABU8GXJ4_9SPHN|nr:MULTISPECIES: flagellar biosynthesis anti-sigma factor FlgM [unclassified Sphingomonas]EZP55486.1 Anti-sigma-28 factor, FlgM family protein [Sphingomonas sp. RIT328]
MVDSIGTTPLNGSGSVSRVAAPAATPVVQPAVQQAAQQAPAASNATQLSNLARTLAAEPPVDSDRIDEIKKAIQNGSFPILPATIADRLLALRLNWNGHDAA